MKLLQPLARSAGRALNLRRASSAKRGSFKKPSEPEKHGRRREERIGATEASSSRSITRGQGKGPKEHSEKEREKQRGDTRERK